MGNHTWIHGQKWTNGLLYTAIFFNRLKSTQNVDGITVTISRALCSQHSNSALVTFQYVYQAQ